MAPRDGKVVIAFTTKLSDEQYSLKNAGELAVSRSFTGRKLSELLNRLLSHSEDATFDFLINGEYLRGTLEQFIDEHAISSENVVTIEYTLASSFRSSNIIKTGSSWISALRVIHPKPYLLIGDYSGTVEALDASQVLGDHSAPITPSRFNLVARRQFSRAPVTSIAAYRSKQHQALSACVAFKDGTIKFVRIDASAGRVAETSPIPAHAVGGCAVSISYDDSLVATAGWDGQIKIWNCLTDQLDAYLVQHDGGDERRGTLFGGCETAGSYCQGTEGNNDDLPRKRSRIPVGGIDKIVPRGTLLRHAMPISEIQFSRDPLQGFLFFSGSLDGSIRIWDPLCQSEVMSWAAGKAVVSLDSALTNNRVLSAHEDGCIRLWDIREHSHHALTSGTATVKSSHVYRAHKRLVTQVRFNPDHEHLFASTGLDGVLNIYDVRCPKVPLQRTSPETSQALDRLLACTWCGADAIYTGGSDGALRIHQLGVADPKIC